MAIYKIDDVLNSIQDMQKDGYEYVNISEHAPNASDKNDTSTLFIEAIEDAISSETDMIDSVTLPDDYSCQLN